MGKILIIVIIGAVLVSCQKSSPPVAPEPTIGAPTLLLPEDGQQTTNRRPQFLWSRDEQTAAYRFQLAHDSTFSTLVFAAEPSDTSLGPDLQGFIYLKVV